MMEFITYEVEGQVGIITINRPKALNALNSAVLDELDATIDGVDLDAVKMPDPYRSRRKIFCSRCRYR